MPSVADQLAQGMKLHEGGQFAQAAGIYAQALQMEPQNAEALHLLGLAQLQLGQHPAAIESLERATVLAPGISLYHANLGSAYGTVGRFSDAVASLTRAVELDPSPAESHNNLGLALNKLGRIDASVASFERAFALRPDFGEAHRNRAVAWLTQGDFARGWPEYEWRWKSSDHPPHHYRQPLWDGGPLAGRTILLHAEQGLGDTIQFVRYVPWVKRLGGCVVLRCQKSLMKLLGSLRRAGSVSDRSVEHELVDQLCGDDAELPQIDVQAPLLSLPYLLRNVLVEIPAQTPYLAADQRLVAYWRHQLERFSEFKVGIVWQGSAKFAGDCFRSIPLAQFAPLARVPGVRLLSLQKGLGSEQVAQVMDRFLVNDLAPCLDESVGPFVDTAAVMKSLDLVITSDTAAAHLAGALGVPVWVALTYAPDWRWQLERDDSPWYPSMKLFRQREPENWNEVFARMARELGRLSLSSSLSLRAEGRERTFLSRSERRQ